MDNPNDITGLQKRVLGPQDSNALGYFRLDVMRDSWLCPYCDVVLFTNRDLRNLPMDSVALFANSTRINHNKEAHNV